jgi:hypothetical protein
MFCSILDLSSLPGGGSSVFSTAHEEQTYLIDQAMKDLRQAPEDAEGSPRPQPADEDNRHLESFNAMHSRDAPRTSSSSSREFQE